MSWEWCRFQRTWWNRQHVSSRIWNRHIHMTIIHSQRGGAYFHEIDIIYFCNFYKIKFIQASIIFCSLFFASWFEKSITCQHFPDKIQVLVSKSNYVHFESTCLYPSFSQTFLVIFFVSMWCCKINVKYGTDFTSSSSIEQLLK